jgi:crossover junction endodeoxyribonuclease RusA
MITLTLPWPPSTNHSHHYGGKRKFLSKPTQKFREEVQNIVCDAKVKIEGRLAMFVALYPPDKRRRDICNYEKQTTDALQAAGVFIDDEQLDFVWLVRRDIVKGGKCVVVLVEHENVGKILKQYEDYI